MTELVKNSLFVRLIVWLYGTLRRFWRSSLLGRGWARWHDSWLQSNTKIHWDAWTGMDDPAEHSVYAKFLRAVEKVLQKIGDWLRCSLLYRILTGIRDGYLKLSSGSRLFSAINRVPLHRWFLLLFPCYLLIEYTVRDLLGIAILASVWEELFIMAGFALVLWRACLKQSDGFSRATALETALLLYMAVGLLLMMLNRPFPAIASAGYRAQVEYIVWYFILLRLIDDEADAKAVVLGFGIVVFLLSLHGIYQYIVAVPIPSSWVSQTEMGVRTRVFSLTGSPNIFGSLLLMGAPIVASCVYYFRNGWMKFLALCATGVICLSILFTFSRGSWVGLVVAVILFALYMDKRLLGLMGMVMAAVLVLIPSITSRLTYLFTTEYAEASAVGGRALRWEVGRNLLHENSPWLGFGLGRFGGAVAMNNQVLDKTKDFEYFYMDNYYLKTLVEMGYLGIIFYIVALIAFAVMAVRAIRACNQGRVWDVYDDALTRSNGNLKCLAVGLFAGMTGVLVHCYFENIFEEPYMRAYFWGLAAALQRLGAISRERSRT